MTDPTRPETPQVGRSMSFADLLSLNGEALGQAVGVKAVYDLLRLRTSRLEDIYTHADETAENRYAVMLGRLAQIQSTLTSLESNMSEISARLNSLSETLRSANQNLVATLRKSHDEIVAKIDELRALADDSAEIRQALDRLEATAASGAADSYAAARVLDDLVPDKAPDPVPVAEEVVAPIPADEPVPEAAPEAVVETTPAEVPTEW